MVDNVFNAQWQSNKGEIVTKNAKATVDGHSAGEILRIADDQRKQAVRKAIATYKDQLAKAQLALTEIDVEAATAAQKEVADQAALALVEITKSRFYYSSDNYITQPIIAFTVTNKGQAAIKRIFVLGSVQTPGRTLPWVSDDFNYEFPGGLEPNESQSLNLEPNMFSDWGHVPSDAVNGSVTTLKLVAYEDAQGKRIGQSADDSDSPAARKQALQDGIQKLEAKIRALQPQ